MVEEFLVVFGDLTVATVVVFAVAVFAAWRIYRKAKKYVIEQYKKEQAKDAKIQKVLDQAAMYPKWRQQSIEKQEEFTKAIKRLAENQEANTKKLEEIEAANRKRERNKLRDRLLQSYRYYTSREKNPMLAWSEMEADSFWKMFKDYEEVDGDGHMHTEVQPAMRSLDVVPMHEIEKITELMQSRR